MSFDLMNDVRIVSAFGTAVGHRRLSIWTSASRGFDSDGWSELSALEAETDEGSAPSTSKCPAVRDRENTVVLTEGGALLGR